MVLEEYRKQADPYLNPIAAYFVRTHPNTMTWLAFVFAVLAGLTFIATNFIGEWSTGALFLAASLIFFNAIFDALDGKVARLAKLESKRGDFLDHVLDRYADFFIIGGMTLSPFCDPWIGVLAFLGVIFASYMGTQAQAVGIKRDYGGLLGRSDRLVLLIFLPLVQMFLEMAELIPDSHHFPVSAGGFTVNLSVIELMMFWFAIAGNTTAIQRAWATWRELGSRENEKAAKGAQPAPAVAEGKEGPAADRCEEQQGWTRDRLILERERLEEEGRELARKATDLDAAVRKLKTDRDALEAESGMSDKRAGPAVDAASTGPSGVEDAEKELDKGTLSLSEATARLRSARLAIERDMRDLKEKEIRLMTLERRIQRRQTEARRK